MKKQIELLKKYKISNYTIKNNVITMSYLGVLDKKGDTQILLKRKGF